MSDKIKILLVNTGFRKPLHPLVSPPLGIMYLAAYIRSKFNAEIILINQKLNNVSNDNIIKSAADFQADVIGLSVMSTAAHSLPYLTKNFKAVLPHSLIVLGGPHVSSYKSYSLNENYADIAVQGEGELVFEKIINAYINNIAFSDIPGIFRRDKDGIIINNSGSVPGIEDLDSLPLPAYDLIDLPKYWKIQSMPPIPGRRYASLFSSRGCPYRCIYCHNIFGNSFRFHSAARIVDEIEYVKKMYGISDFEFLDDIFNLNHERLKEFSKLVRRKNLSLELAFPNGVRTDIFKKDEIDMLIECGLYFSSFALESGSPRIQKLIGKNLNLEKFLENVLYAVKQGVFSNGFAMFGFPTETAEEMQMTLDLICASRLHTASFFTVTPFPNTELYSMMQKSSPQKLGLINYDNMEFSLAPINLSAVSDRDLYRFQRKANIRMLLNPMRLFRIIRDIPRPYLLPLYLPEFIRRITKGLFRN